MINGTQARNSHNMQYCEIHLQVQRKVWSPTLDKTRMYKSEWQLLA